MRRLLIALLLLLATPALAKTQTQTFTGPFTTVYTTGTSTSRNNTAVCTSPDPTTLNCTLPAGGIPYKSAQIWFQGQAGAAGGVDFAPIVTPQTCNINSPITTGVNVVLNAGGSCTYAVTCGGGPCSGPNAITGWAITSQSTANSFAITSGGVIQGGSAASGVGTAAYTVTVTATNSTGTSPGVTQTINTLQVPVVSAGAFSLTLPLSSGFAVGTMTATHSSTSWTISSVTGGTSQLRDFAISSAGLITTTTFAPSDIIAPTTVTITVTATNANGASSPGTATVTVNAASAAAFQGNTLKSISAITAGITCYNEVGTSVTVQTPGMVRCSGSPTTATGTSNPYIDLQYIWTYTDASADCFAVTSPIGTRCATTQYGPEFRSLFRTAGTYTVTLAVRGCTSGHPTTAYTGGGGACNGGTLTTSTATVSVVANAWTGTDYYFTAAGSDSNACTTGAPCATPSKCASLLDTGTSNLRCNFNCGDTFNADTGSSFRLHASATYSHQKVRSATTVGAVCSTSNPAIWHVTGSNNCIDVEQNSGGGIKSDIVVSNISCTNTTGSTQGTGVFIYGGNTGGGSLNDVVMDMVQVNSSQTSGGIEPYQSSVAVACAVGTPCASAFEAMDVWGGSYTTPVGSVSDGTAALLPQAMLWMSVTGVTMSGESSDAVHDHHLYAHCGGHCAFRWNIGGASCSGGGCTPTHNFCIKTAYDPTDGDGSTQASNYWLLTENFCQGTAAFSAPANNALAVADSNIDQYVAQQNVFSGISSGLTNYVGYNIAFRDNWGCMTGTNSASEPNSLWTTSTHSANGSFQVASIYRNLGYSTAAVTSSENPMIDFDFLGSETYTSPQTVFDNIMENTNATGILMDIPSTNFVSNGSVVNYNTVYAPSNATPMMNSNSAISYATWQGLGWDAQGANINPGWSSPSTCGFGTWPY